MTSRTQLGVISVSVKISTCSSEVKAVME